MTETASTTAHQAPHPFAGLDRPLPIRPVHGDVDLDRAAQLAVEAWRTIVATVSRDRSQPLDELVEEIREDPGAIAAEIVDVGYEVHGWAFSYEWETPDALRDAIYSHAYAWADGLRAEQLTVSEWPVAIATRHHDPVMGSMWRVDCNACDATTTAVLPTLAAAMVDHHETEHRAALFAVGVRR